MIKKQQHKNRQKKTTTKKQNVTCTRTLNTEDFWPGKGTMPIPHPAKSFHKQYYGQKEEDAGEKWSTPPPTPPTLKSGIKQVVKVLTNE